MIWAFCRTYYFVFYVIDNWSACRNLANHTPFLQMNEELPLFQNLNPASLPTEATQIFSKYIVYVDESGDHGMESIDEQFPVFVLAFCVFHKGHYSEKVVPALEKFKFKHFGHDQIVLHESDIRKERGYFRIFPNKAHKHRFLDELTSIIEESKFILISCVIDKKRLKEQQEKPPNPYHIALRFCLETLHDFLKEKGEEHKRTHIIVEQRGKKEDNELELEFRRICDGQNSSEENLPFEILFSDKKAKGPGETHRGHNADRVLPVHLKNKLLLQPRNTRKFDSCHVSIYRFALESKSTFLSKE